jgi:hypothetical protein
MNMEMADYFPTDEHLELLALSRAMALIEVAADPAGAKQRLKELKAATTALAAERAAAEKVIADATTKSATLARADEGLATRITEFQTWVDFTEKSYRERENRIRLGEENQAAREAKLVQGESDLARRVAAHEQRLASLKETLA